MKTNTLLKIKFIFTVLSLAGMTSALVACGTKSADLVNPPEVIMADGVSGGNIQFDFNPKVDVLFVMDDSESEKAEQVKFQDAINDFTDGFGENNLIDYRVGVISIYDEQRCDKEKIDKNGKPILCHPESILRSPFVSRGPNSKKQIYDNIAIGILPLYPVAPEIYSGPEYDSIFKPIVKAFDPAINHQNGDFFRSDSRKVIVIIDDEDDYSNISVDDFLYNLNQVAGKNVDLYGVISQYYKNGQLESCPQSKWASPPKRLRSAIEQKNGKIFPICDTSYGKYLSTIGSDIRKRALTQDIVLKSIPERNTITLSYGGKSIPMGQGWSYNPEIQTISINDKIKINYDPNSHFAVDYVKVENKAILNGHATPVIH